MCHSQNQPPLEPRLIPAVTQATFQRDAFVQHFYRTAPCSVYCIHIVYCGFYPLLVLLFITACSGVVGFVCLSFFHPGFYGPLCQFSFFRCKFLCGLCSHAIFPHFHFQNTNDPHINYSSQMVWSLAVHFKHGKHCIPALLVLINPFTPKSDQCQISPAASPETLRHTVWRTWLFIAYSGERWLYYKYLLPHLYIFSLRGWENVLFELRSERVNTALVQWECKQSSDQS